MAADLLIEAVVSYWTVSFIETVFLLTGKVVLLIEAVSFIIRTVILFLQKPEKTACGLYYNTKSLWESLYYMTPFVEKRWHLS